MIATQLHNTSRFGALAAMMLSPLLVAAPSNNAAALQRALVDKYCVGCHNQRIKTAGLILDKADLAHVGDDAEVWEKVVTKLRSNAMPPQGVPGPEPAAREAVVSFLETSLGHEAAIHPNPGRTILHRLNRAEYGNAVRDLLGMDFDAASLLPPDDSGYGFDNIADVLSVSPMLTERYLSAARKISRLATGDTSIRPSAETYSIDKLTKQDDRLSEDLPFGSRAGLAIHSYFPVDGDYVARIYFLRTYDGRMRGMNEPHQLEVRLNGDKVKQITVGAAPLSNAGPGRGRGTAQEDGIEVHFSVKAGPALVAVTFLKEAGMAEGMLRPKYPVTSYEYAGDATIPPGIGSVELRGPYDIRGPGESPSRKRIFVCHPAPGTGLTEDACANQILMTLARRAYRRPVTGNDIEPLIGFYTNGRNKGGFDSGIEMALQRILVSPDFLFRLERDPAKLAPGSPYEVSDVELASRLSFFLWSSIPDDELLDIAARGQLRQPGVLEKQVRRMLADSRSKAMITNFTGQWLYLRNIAISPVDTYAFPDFDDNLREAFTREMELFLDSQFREDHSVTDLLNADYTYVNERLAQHYRIPNIYGSHFRRVTLTDESRKGLLGKGGILMVTSYADRTSPVKRGKWLLENILGAPPPPPPPNVPALKANAAGEQAHSVRERLEEHRANPACSGCHKVMDPLGFAMENFDAVGKWRTTGEGGSPIDASGQLVNGTKVDGPASLRLALMARREEFARTVTRKLLTYALGRGAEYYDEPAIRKIVHDAASGEFRWSSLILGIVKSPPFEMRTTAKPAPGSTREISAQVR